MAPIVVLNVAEKPSVARALAQVFGNTPGSRQSQAHRSGPAQIFEIENVNFPSLYQQGSGQIVPNNVRSEPHTMIISSVRGHLASQDFGPAYGWSRCPPQALFDAPINTEYSQDMQPLERMLRDLSRRASALILWLDCDREGEAISDEVRTVCIKGNPRLQSQNRIYRAKFSTVLPGEIQRALRSLGRINEHFVQAVKARSEHDLRVGAAFTRFQTLRLQKKFDGFQDSGVISYGPCQFPTLGFVVERWARIETFVPEDFWTIEMSIRLNGDGSVNNSDQHGNSNNNQQSRPIKLTWKRGRLYDRAMTMALCDACQEAGEAVVTSLTGRPKNKWRPIPLATVELQKRASKYLRIGSEELMQKAEELYQQGFISYPRTETEKFRPEFNHHTLIQSFQAVAGEFGDYANRLLSDNNFQNPRAGQNDDNAHPPITPAKAVDPQTIADPTQRKIYTLVVKHYLACCSRDAVGRETELTLRIASEEFVAKGLMILERNWLDIYQPWEKWYTGQGELPRARIGSRIVPTSLSMNAGQTSPPQLISEVELIALMDRNGIGTDATIAQHITTIMDRKYAEKDGNQRFHPTKLGIALVEGYNSMGYQLNKPDLRREMESECNAVAAGRKTRDQILGPILSKMLECFKIVNAEVHKLDEAVARHFNNLGSDSSQYRVLQANFTRCGSCNGKTVLKQRTGGGSNRGGGGDSGGSKLLQCAPCSKSFLMPRYIREVRPGVNPNNQQEPLICPICQFQVVECVKDDGGTYFVCPQCFSDPPEEHGGDSTDFPCTKCTHPTCSLAKGTRGGDVEIFSCPFCGSSGNGAGKVCLKRGQHGYRLSCSNGGPNSCQFTIWLPKEAREIVIDDSTGSCNRCSNPNRVVRQLKFIWKPGSVPPHYDRELCACVLCDEQLKNDMNIRIPAVNEVNYRRTGNSAGGRGNQSSNSWGSSSNNNSRGGRGNQGSTSWSSSNNSAGRPGRGRGRGGRGGRGSTSWGGSSANGRGGGGGGGSIQCFSCGGPHYANVCPNRQQQ